MPTRYQGSLDEIRALDAFLKLTRAAASLTTPVQRRLEQSHGLTTSQIGVLDALLHLGPLTAGTLARKLLRSPTNLTTVLDNLERDGLVRREQSASDRRTCVIHLTEAGQERVADALPCYVRGITALMSGLSPSEQEQLGRLCRRLGLSVQESNGSGRDRSAPAHQNGPLPTAEASAA